MTARRASILLFALGVVTVLTVLCYGFLQSVVGLRSGSRAVELQSLAMRSAESGAQHVLEQVLRDHVAGGPTRMDSLALAAFRAHHFPFAAFNITATPRDGRITDLHDVAPENYLHHPAWNRSGSAYEYEEEWGQHMNDQQTGSFAGPHDGRGRWLEPGLHGYGAPHSLLWNGATWQLPGLPVRFGDGDGQDLDGAGWLDGELDDVGVYLARTAPWSVARSTSVDVRSPLVAGGAGVRCQPLLLDKDLRRMPYATASEALQVRREARYRLRYAAMVRDLDGLLLVNPDARLDWRAVGSPDPRAYADPELARVVRHLHAVHNLVLPLTRFDRDARLGSIAARVEHVYLGRGSTMNYATAAGDGLPRTFPLMYRQDGELVSRFMSTWYDNNNWRSVDHRTNPQPIPADRIFGPLQDPAGWQPVASTAGTKGHTWRHDLLGPQYSFFNANLAVRGTASDTLSDNRNLDGDYHPLMWLTTPFGAGLRTDRGGRYRAAVDTPWHLNLLTAHPMVLRALIIGSMPPGAVTVNYVRTATPYDASSTTYRSTTRGINDLWNRSHSPAFEHYPAPARASPAICPDYRSRSAVPGEPLYRHPQLRYPGPLLFNGLPPDGDGRTAVSDGVGAVIDVSTRALAKDPHVGFDYLMDYDGGDTGLGFPAVGAPSDIGWTGKDVAGTDGNPDDKDSQTGTTLATPRRAHWDRLQRDYDRVEYRLGPDAFWRDLGVAFNAAVTVARRGHARFEGMNYQPRSTDAFQTSPECRPPTLAAFDRLLLACLGHDPDDPAAPPPTMPDKQAWGGNPPVRYTPNRNLATANDSAVLPDISVRLWSETALAPDPDAAVDPAPNLTVAAGAASSTYTATAAQRTQAAELVVNDFRFSLLGSSPAYSLAFRPLDLNGDGLVAFSGYAASRHVIADAGQEAARNRFRIDEDCPAQAGGQGEWASDLDGDGRLSLAEFRAAGIEPFCMTGNLFIGQSRFWHAIIRGEVWDNGLRQQTAQATLETVWLVDQAEAAERGEAGRQFSTQVVFQRWHHNMYQGLNRRGD